MCLVWLLAVAAAAAPVLKPERLIQPSPTDDVSALAISADGKWIASLSKDGFLRNQLLPDGFEGWSVPAPGSPWKARLHFSGDGKQLALAIENELRLFDPATGKLSRTIAGAKMLCSDGKRYLKGAQLFELATDKPSGPALDADLVNPDCSLYAKLAFKGNCHPGSDGLTHCDQDLVGGEVATAHELWRHPAGGAISIIGFTADGTGLLVWGGLLLDARTGQTQSTLPVELSDLDKVAFSREAAAAPRKAGELQVSRRSDGGALVQFKNQGANSGGEGIVLALEFSPDGSTLYTGDNYGNIEAFRVSDGKLLFAVGSAGYVHGGGLSPDGRFAAVVTWLSGAIVYDVASGRPLKRIDGAPPYPSYGSAVFSPDGGRLAISGGSIKVFGVPGFALQQEMQETSPSTPSFSADGSRLLAVKSSYGNPVLWNTENGSQVKKLDAAIGGGMALLSPDAKYGLLADDKKLDVWNLQTGAMARDLEGLPGQPDRPSAMALSPDGTTFAAFTQTGALAIWDFKTAELRKTVETGVSGVSHLAFSSDGALLLASGYSGASVVDAATGEVKATGEINTYRYCGAFLPGARTFVTCHKHGLAVFRLAPEPVAEAPPAKPRRKH